ncbi:hypothetical protein E2C01_044582 [Portunus trituberculatus]|uniref:SCAN box domain-containing protein n=1 Tax=Portunus trituberculatus TaxID=210409 RepID=A0A5B7FW15_PORTR|nr:hypothetical protein [Portunus trituberculatus]
MILKDELVVLATHLNSDFFYQTRKLPLANLLKHELFGIICSTTDHRVQDEAASDIGERGFHENPVFIGEAATPFIPNLSAAEYMELEKIKLELEHKKIQLDHKFRMARLQEPSSSSMRQDYDPLKEAILDAYQIRPEAYRQTFRKVHKRSDQTHRQFLYDMNKVFIRWLQSSNVSSFESLKELVMLENFLWKIEPQVASFLREKQVHSLDEAATLADDYVLNQRLNKSMGKYLLRNLISPRLNSNSNPTNTKFVQSPPGALPASPRIESPDQGKYPSPNSFRRCKTCSYCNKIGYVELQCFKKSRDENRRSPVAAMTDITRNEHELTLGDRSDTIACVIHNAITKTVDYETGTNPSLKTYGPFLSRGSVSLGCLEYPVRVLRDTGTSRTLLLNPNPAKCFSNKYIALTGAGGPFSAQLAEVDPKCELHWGEAVIGVVEKLPTPGVDLLLGNDLCGNRVRVDCPVTSVVPLSDSTTEALEMDFPGTFPVCAVTRSLGQVTASPMMQHPGTSSATDDLAVSPADTRPSPTPTETEVPDLSKLFVLDSEVNKASPVLPLDTPQSLVELQEIDECKRFCLCCPRGGCRKGAG